MSDASIEADANLRDQHIRPGCQDLGICSRISSGSEMYRNSHCLIPFSRHTFTVTKYIRLKQGGSSKASTRARDGDLCAVHVHLAIAGNKLLSLGCKRPQSTNPILLNQVQANMTSPGGAFAGIGTLGECQCVFVE